MTRILYWNIENFGYNKIRPTTGKRNRAGHLIPDVKALDRRALIISHIANFAPDIFVIVEVSTGARAEGTLASMTGGWDGCEELLARIAAATGVNWNMVPPLVVGTGGRAEAVAIMYKTAVVGGGQRYFTGPNGWSTGGISFDPTVLPAPLAGNYPAGVRATCFPLGARVIPAGTQYSAGIDERLCAARFSFRNLVGAPINYNGYRSPYMATFSEVNGPAIRDISVIAIHAPPSAATAAVYLNQLANNQDVAAVLGGNERRVIVGDFNVNLLAVNGGDANRYAALTALGYAQQLVPPIPGIPVNLNAYKGYFATHLKGRNSAFLWSTAAAVRPYPGYQYIGSQMGGNVYSIDNILVRGGMPANFAIVNSVVGSHLNVVPAPPNGAPIGIAGLNSVFGNPPVGWPSNPAPASVPGLPRSLRGWNNYGRVRSTSDHFALIVTV